MTFEKGIKCPLCWDETEFIEDSELNICQYNCKTCGRFAVDTGVQMTMFTNREMKRRVRLRAAAVIRERWTARGGAYPLLLILDQAPNGEIPISYAWITLRDVLSRFPSTVSARRDRALGNLAKMSRSLGQQIELKECDYPVLFALDPSEMRFMAKILEKAGFVSQISTKDSLSVTLEARGWDRLAELDNQGRLASCKQAFVAMNFHPDLNEVWEKGLSSAIDDAGFRPMRVDFEEHNDYIPDKIMAEIRRSRFLVADVTGQKQGVYFEAGFALGLGIPVIWTCRKDEIDQCHFDTKQISHILWETPEDLKAKLVNRIRATIV